MRIIIDMLGVQSDVSLLEVESNKLLQIKNLICNCNKHEIFLVLSNDYVHTIKYIRDYFKEIIPQDNFKVWYPFEEGKSNMDFPCKGINHLIREEFFLNIRPDLVLLTNLSEDSSSHYYSSITQSSLLGRIIFNDINLTLSNFDFQELDYIIVPNKFSFYLPEYQNKIIEISKVGDILSNLNTKFEIILNKETTSYLSKEKKLKLAYISPLPPLKSGIADYSAELIGVLAKYYDIDVIVDQKEVTDEWILKNCSIVSIKKFEKQETEYSRILYHFGNNPMHVKMFELLKKFPGVVVLHDFFLSGVQWYRESVELIENSLWNELYFSHGYHAIRERKIENDEAVVFRYPCNFSVLEQALGTIVHSKHSLQLAKKWYKSEFDFSILPLLRQPAKKIDREYARKILGIDNNVFLVCSFGFIGKTKQNHRLLDALEASSLLSSDKNTKLVFVGEHDNSLYAQDLIKRIEKYKKKGEVSISGWTDNLTYTLYLAAADVAVQLRTLSRGETSAAVLDCLNYGIATIINANGSLADIPDHIVCKIPDEFSDSDLINELENIYYNSEKRSQIALTAQKIIHQEHSPEYCAEQYFYTIEKFYLNKIFSAKKMAQSIVEILPSGSKDKNYLIDLSKNLARNFTKKNPSRTLYIDVSVVAKDDFKTGIQRAVRALTLALLDAPPKGFRIEPVYLSENNGKWNYRYARQYTLSLLDMPHDWVSDDIIEPQSGDILLGLDLAGGYVIKADQQGIYRDLQNLGVRVLFVVYDLIPLQFENIYPTGFKEGHAEWLKVVAKSDSAICISKTVAEEFNAWLKQSYPQYNSDLEINWFHLGADIATSFPTTGLPKNGLEILKKISKSNTFLMVGTVEPRKGHAQVVDAFSQLWNEGHEVNLVIVGKKGWMVDDLVKKLMNHPELNKKFYWLDSISDEFLEKVYEASDCLIAASYGEGFGLPLIEAAQHKMPIIARDIPVFKEVAGQHAFYFKAEEPKELTAAIKDWQNLYMNNQHPSSLNMPWLTWKQSAERLSQIILE